MIPVFFRPGQQLQRFHIYRKMTEVDCRGRIHSEEEPKEVGEMIGSVSFYEEKESSVHKRVQHTVSHVIVVHGICIAQAEDVLKTEKESYIIHAAESPGNLRLFTVLYCECTKGR